MKIVKLTTNNIKRLAAVEITPAGDMVVIGGKNGAGKSSVLDSIAYALGGKGTTPTQPIRKGEEKAEVVVELDNIVVTRRFTENGSTLTVTNADGSAKFSSPQAMLDALVGRLSFDPLAFSRMKPAEQAGMMRELVGIDTTELDASRAEAYAERTNTNRDVKNLEGKLSGLTRHEDVPAEEVSIATLLAKRTEAQGRADVARSAAENLTYCESAVEKKYKRIAEIEAQLKAEKSDLAKLIQDRDDAQSAKRQADANHESDDIAKIDNQIKTCEAQNAKVRETIEYGEVSESIKVLRKKADDLTEQIEKIDEAKAAKLAGVTFPVEGLGLTDGGLVSFNGVPFDQASAAEQLRVSVAMGLAMNPKLRVVLIRDGSLLDDDSMKLIATMAAEKDAQVWVERVGEGEEVSVVIEDGHVKPKND